MAINDFVCTCCEPGYELKGVESHFKPNERESRCDTVEIYICTVMLIFTLSNFSITTPREIARKDELLENTIYWLSKGFNGDETTVYQMFVREFKKQYITCQVVGPLTD